MVFCVRTCDVWINGAAEWVLLRHQHQGDRNFWELSPQDQCMEVLVQRVHSYLYVVLEAEVSIRNHPSGTGYEGFRGHREHLKLGTL